MTREEKIKCLIQDVWEDYRYKGYEAFKKVALKLINWADEHPKNPWVSVKKRPPEENEPVLLWLGGCYKVALLRDCRWWECTGFQIGRGWSALDALSIREVECITHWMPITTCFTNPDQNIKANSEIV